MLWLYCFGFQAKGTQEYSSFPISNRYTIHWIGQVLDDKGGRQNIRKAQCLTGVRS